MLEIPFDNLSDAQRGRIRTHLRREIPVFNSKRCRVLHFYEEICDDKVRQLRVPRYFAREHLEVRVSPPIREPSKLTFACELEQSSTRPQKKAFELVLRQLDKIGGATLVMPPGTGKTNLGIAIALQCGKTIVLAHRDMLLSQWRQRILKFVQGETKVEGNETEQNEREHTTVLRRDVKIGLIQQDECEYEDCDFVLVSMKSLLARRYPPEALRARLLIVDEAHHAAAPSYFKALGMIDCAFTLALTATPARSDGLDKIMEWLLGPCAFRHELPPNAHVQVNFVQVNFALEIIARDRQGRLRLPDMITALTTDPTRNELLVSLMKVLRHKFPARKGLLLSARVDHVQLLYDKLNDKNSFDVITGKIHTSMS
jgi:superfamily II DNA or RNA helicase